MSVVPAMLRRRLSAMGRVALSLVIPLIDQWGDMPIVYVSRHGEVGRTLGLLQDMARGELMSPTAFSLSVHNSTAGLYSIHRGLTKNITAMSGGSEDLLPGLLEALGQCTAEEPQVLVLFCDEPVPELYRHQVNQPEALYALALVLNRGASWVLEALGQPQANSAEPQSLQLLQHLEASAPSLMFSDSGCLWQLRRSH